MEFLVLTILAPIFGLAGAAETAESSIHSEDWVRQAVSSKAWSPESPKWRSGPYFHFNNISSNGDFETGYVRGNPGHLMSRNEYRSNERAKGRVRWMDSDGDTGSHVWDLNHVADYEDDSRYGKSVADAHSSKAPNGHGWYRPPHHPHHQSHVDFAATEPAYFPREQEPSDSSTFESYEGGLSSAPDEVVVGDGKEVIQAGNQKHPRYKCPVVESRSSDGVLITRDCEGNPLYRAHYFRPSSSSKAQPPLPPSYPGSYGDVREYSPPNTHSDSNRFRGNIELGRRDGPCGSKNSKGGQYKPCGKSTATRGNRRPFKNTSNRDAHHFQGMKHEDRPLMFGDGSYGEDTTTSSRTAESPPRSEKQHRGTSTSAKKNSVKANNAARRPQRPANKTRTRKGKANKRDTEGLYWFKDLLGQMLWRQLL